MHISDLIWNWKARTQLNHRKKWLGLKFPCLFAHFWGLVARQKLLMGLLCDSHPIRSSSEAPPSLGTGREAWKFQPAHLRSNGTFYSLGSPLPESPNRGKAFFLCSLQSFSRRLGRLWGVWNNVQGTMEAVLNATLHCLTHSP